MSEKLEWKKQPEDDGGDWKASAYGFKYTATPEGWLYISYPSPDGTVSAPLDGVDTEGAKDEAQYHADAISYVLNHCIRRSIQITRADILKP